MKETKFEVCTRRKDGSDKHIEVLTLDQLLDRNGSYYSPSIQEIVYKREYTTKKDFNGKEIYDGDIIEFDRKEWGGDDNIHIVSWNQRCAEWSWGGGGDDDMEWRTVIGNIYENPELTPKPTND